MFVSVISLILFAILFAPSSWLQQMYSQVVELVNKGASSKEAEADDDVEEVSNDTNLDEDEFSESEKVVNVDAVH